MVKQTSMQDAISEVKSRKEELLRFIEEVLQSGVDYGRIPKTDKYCLFKSGAEKLCDMYNYGKRFELISRDVEQGDAPYFSYEMKSILFDYETGQIVAEGVGACNSKEKKYQKYSPFDAANMVLKMAKKRAFVDAVLTATRSSDIFSQDLEDETSKEPSEKQQGTTKAKGQTQQKAQEKQPASSKQIDYIYSLLSQKRVTVEQARKELQKRYQVNDIKGLDRDQASDFIQILKEHAA